MKHTQLQRMRDAANITNGEMARRFRVSESFISKIMSGDRKNDELKQRIVAYIQDKQKRSA